jgi:hypothetical protein
MSSADPLRNRAVARAIRQLLTGNEADPWPGPAARPFFRRDTDGRRG